MDAYQMRWVSSNFLVSVRSAVRIRKSFFLKSFYLLALTLEEITVLSAAMTLKGLVLFFCFFVFVFPGLSIMQKALTIT